MRLHEQKIDGKATWEEVVKSIRENLSLTYPDLDFKVYDHVPHTEISLMAKISESSFPVAGKMVDRINVSYFDESNRGKTRWLVTWFSDRQIIDEATVKVTDDYSFSDAVSKSVNLLLRAVDRDLDRLVRE